MIFRNKKYSVILLIFLLIILPTSCLVAKVTPNDPKIGNQNYLEPILAYEAWERNTGSDEVVVAVIDSGVDINHPDLINNIWVNKGEIPEDGIDNDNNGYIDDYNGWDFVASSADPSPKIISDYSAEGVSHGTFVSGIIAAEGNNNIGISGIAWHSKIMPLRVLNSQGNGDFEDIIEAINYAVDNDADILNFSLVSVANVSTLNDAIENAYLKGKIIVAAAGNDGLVVEGFDGGYNLDFFPFYPVCHDGSNNNTLGVVSVDGDDIKSSFSNYGPTCIDLSAPGEEFYGLNYYNPLYPEFRDYYQGGWSGTSMSAPLVSGAAALLKSYRPDFNNFQIYELLINSGDDINLLNPYYISRLGKRLNLLNLLNEAAETTYVSNREIVVSPAKNYPPIVAIYDITGKKINEFYAYNINFTGGVNVVGGDVKSSWEEEIITAAGIGGGPHIKVFNQEGNLLSEFFAYQSDFIGGVEVETIKYLNESEQMIITAPQSSHKSQIKIFDYKGNLLNEFLAFPEEYIGGITLATGDVNDDGLDEIIIAKKDSGSLVRIFNQQGNLLSQFESYNQEVNGISLAVLESNDNDLAQIVTAPLSGYQAEIKKFDFWGNLLDSFLAYDESNYSGINLDSADIDLDGESEILTAPSSNYVSEIRSYSPTGVLEINFEVLSNDFHHGVKFSTIN